MNLEYKLVRSRRKTTALYVLSDGSLLIRAPLRLSAKLITNFVDSKKEWIENQRARLALQSPTANLMNIRQTGKVLYMGDFYPVELVEQASRPIVFDGMKFSLAGASDKQSTIFLEKWYRDQARKILKERIAWFANKTHLQPKKLRITSARTRWGSCSSKGTLSFTWRLVMAPVDVIDYVVVHELVHLLINNHQKSFWNKVSEILPDYKERRGWLKKHGLELMNTKKIVEI